MDIAMGVAGNLVTGVFEFMIQNIIRNFSYISHYRRRVSDLESKVGMLKEIRDRVLKDVDAAEKNGESIYADVKTWLHEADKIVSELDEVKGLEDEAEIGCFIGLCPNFKARYQVSSRAEEDASAVDELLQRGKFDKVSYRDVPEPVVFAHSKGFEAFESRKQAFYDILKAVKDPSINMIGVYGMPGVGKTMLAKEVARHAREDKLFDSVVMAAVTPTPDIYQIQSEIAEMLGLKLEEQTRTGRASRLCERLKDKKILVILDDIWERLDPMEVGIPFGNEHPGCTILLTSRDLHVLSKGMDSKKSFPIEVLEQGEAWDLFKKMAGDSVESLELLHTATKIAKKCGGLPIAIKAVATTLRNEPLFEWEDALQRLNNPSSSNYRGVPPDVYSAIELSYNRLKSDEHRQIFLLCSLIGHHSSIRDLLKYAMGLRLFHGVSTVEATRNRLLTVVSHLKACYLLLDGYSNRWFYMHDLISDVGISIASKDNHVFVLKNEDAVNDWPDEDTMTSWDKISLPYASISHLPGQLICPKLRFLYMGSKDTSMVIPNTFFMEMKILKVLDLTKMNFSSLPSSISMLSNLRTLCLDQCLLGDISLIGELKNLEILSLFLSSIETLPKEIGQLIKLKMFDLSHCLKLKTIPSGVLCNLCRLEQLLMDNSFVQWEAEGHPGQQSNASLVELKPLSCLTVLDVHIPNADIIPDNISFEKLQRYNILIGEAWDWIGASENSRTLKLNLQTSIGFLNYGIKDLLKKVENLYLDEMKGLEILVQEWEARDYFQQLKNLHIQNGALIKYILKDPNIEFPQLQSLTLHGLPKLISFCPGNDKSTSISPQGMALLNQKIVFPKLEKVKLSSIGIESLWHPQRFCSTPNLTSLIIEGCANLKHVFSYSTAEYLPQLQFLEISDCKCIHEMISTEEMIIEAPISFPRLNSLKLKDLHKLIRFCHEDYTVEFPSLMILEIENCPELKGFTHKSTSVDGVLFNKKVAFPRLEKISVSHLRNVKRVWYNQLHADSFCNLKELKVEYCDALVNIFSPFLREVFQGLETLEVSDCASLEEVFQFQGLDIEEIDVVVASRLRQVELIRLPNLKHVWNKDPGGNISFGNLQEVRVLECQSLKSVFPFSIAKGLPQLESLTISGCGVEEIVTKNNIIGTDKQEFFFEFNQLSFLKLWLLPNLRCFYPGMHSTKWPKLKQLKTNKCKKIQIFGHAESQIQSLFLIEKVIPQLEEISLSSDEIAMISDGPFAEDFFCRIKFLHITCYHSESDVFPFSFLQRFYNLETLEVFCSDFKDLSSYECNAGEVTALPQIKNMKLYGLKIIRHLWRQGSALERICACLESLEVWESHNLINLSSPSSSFQNLTTLDVWNCKNLAELFSSSQAQSLSRLVTMRIRECEMLGQVIASEEDEATPQEIVFRELKGLGLHCLASLKSFCSGNCTFKFPALEHVTLSQCPRLKNFSQGGLSTPKLKSVQLTGTDYRGYWAGDLNRTVELLFETQVGYHGLKQLKFSEFPELIDIWSRNPQEMLDFKNLEFIEVCDSSNLRCIFNLSLAFSLSRLQHMEIRRCSNMEQVIKEDGYITMPEEATTYDHKIISVFPGLQSIIVESCPDMTSFYLGSSALECSSLTEITVADCPNITTFISTFSRDEDKEAIIGDDSTTFFCNKIGDEKDSAATFFSDKVAFPNVAKLTLCHLRNVKRIWNSQLHADSFSKLMMLEASYCDTLVNIFPSYLLKVFERLKSLTVTNCASLQEVFQLQGLDTENAFVVGSQLSEVTLLHLPMLKHIWNKDPNENICFENLRVVCVLHCESLRSVFPYSIAKGVAQLETLKVMSCGTEEIVSKNMEGSDEQEVCFEFNHLSFLVLDNLQNLKCFYPGMHSATWPKLQQLRTYKCGEMKIFGHRQSQIQPLFLLDKIIPQLENVSFTSDDIAMINDGQFVQDLFCHIKCLQIRCYHSELPVFPFSFLQRFYNLETLKLFCSDFKDLSPYQDDIDMIIVRPKIKKLELDYIVGIQSLWRKHSPLDHICSSLESLEVHRCRSLINLSAASSSFQNLSTLDVWNCKSLAELITSSKAQSLDRLVTLRIRECEVIGVVISSEGDDEIIFRELKCLELHCLPNLTSFCSGNCAFNFPSLNQVIVSQCPTMKNFCHGPLSTPKLQMVQLTTADCTGRWAGDLNAIIEQLNIQVTDGEMSEEKQEDDGL